MKGKKIIMVTLLIVFSLIIYTCFIFGKNKLNTNKISSVNNNESDIYAKVYDYEQYKELPIYYNDAIFQYDTSTPEKAAGVADYVFVAKVNSILRTEYRHPIEVTRDGVEKIIYDPFTVYSATVIKNIKGEITEEIDIEVVQYGGLNEDESSFSFIGEMKLLNVGEYYILLANASPDSGELKIEQQSSIVSLGNLEETEIQTIKSEELIQSTMSITSEQIVESNKAYTSTIEIVSKYVEASEKAIVPEGKVLNKSKLYDKELYRWKNKN